MKQSRDMIHPDGHDLLRIAKKRGYEVDSCRFAFTREELGDVFELCRDAGEPETKPIYEAWFDSHGTPHFRRL